MLKRPSSRRRTGKEIIELNLVPMLDALVTLISFLLFSMSFLAIVSIESPVPITSPSQLADTKKPLQLTLTLKNDSVRIWSPFELVKGVDIPSLPDGQPNLVAIHQTLVEIKQKFPTENKIVVVPAASITYDVLVAVMDSARTFEKTDSPIFIKNPKTGNDELTNLLFPEIIFGNLLGES